MGLLFDSTATSCNPGYNFICDHPSKTAGLAKEYTESRWKKFHPYADSNFMDEIRIEFNERFWKMYLTCTLMDKGMTITKKAKNAEPDVRIERKGNIP